MDLQITEVMIERTGAPAPYDALLGLQATLDWQINGRTFLREPLFPIAEFALALSAWLGSGFLKSRDLNFDSLESEKSPFVWVHHQDAGWTVGAAFAESAPIDRISDDEIRAAFETFVERVESELRAFEFPPLSGLQ